MSQTKKRVLIFIDWFTPAYKAGGPIKSITAIVNVLGDFFDFYIVTSNTDLNEETQLSNVNANIWITKEKYNIIYLSKDKQNNQQYKKIANEINPNLIYFNSIFSITFTLKPLLLFKKKDVKIVVAPRGMLGDGALKIKSLKKKTFLLIVKKLGVFSNVVWHVSSEQEKTEVLLNIGKKANVYVAPNLSFYSKIKAEKSIKQENKLNLFFISRISKKKNLDYAIDVLMNIEEPIKIEFDIYGPIEDGLYWELVQKKIKQLPKNISVRYLGPILSERVSEIIFKYDAFLFPTIHENYGHVIVEAFGAGCPVVISNSTPWRNLKELGVGYDICLNDSKLFVDAIVELAKLNDTEYKNKIELCFKFAEKISHSEDTIEKNKNIFL